MTVVDAEQESDTWSIVSMLREVLARVVAGFELAGDTLPARQFIKTGTPVADCEQVVVVFRQIFIGPPGDEAQAPQRCDGPRSAHVEVWITRCIPTPAGTRNTSPPIDKVQEAAELQMRDAWLLLDLAPALDTWNGMGPGGPGVIATAEAGEAKGGFQSTVLTLTMQVP